MSSFTRTIQRKAMRVNNKPRSASTGAFPLVTRPLAPYVKPKRKKKRVLTPDQFRADLAAKQKARAALRIASSAQSAKPERGSRAGRGAAIAAKREAHRRLFRAQPVGSSSIAKVNRHTGKPHQHKREIARRLRQQGGAA